MCGRWSSEFSVLRRCTIQLTPVRSKISSNLVLYSTANGLILRSRVLQAVHPVYIQGVRGGALVNFFSRSPRSTHHEPESMCGLPHHRRFVPHLFSPLAKQMCGTKKRGAKQNGSVFAVHKRKKKKKNRLREGILFFFWCPFRRSRKSLYGSVFLSAHFCQVVFRDKGASL